MTPAPLSIKNQDAKLDHKVTIDIFAISARSKDTCEIARPVQDKEQRSLIMELIAEPDVQ